MRPAEAVQDLRKDQAEQTKERTPLVNRLAPDEGKLFSLEEYRDRWYETPYLDFNVSYEWNSGVLEAKPSVIAPQIELGFWRLFLPGQYLYPHDIARLTKLETGYILTMEDASVPSGIRRAVRKHAEQGADSETAARRQAEERPQSLEAEQVRLRRRSS